MEQRRSSDVAFEAFWKAYPRKTAKLAAKRAWDKLRPDAALVQQMLDALEWQREQWDDPRYIPHPASWLNGARWEDEPVEPKAIKPMSSAAATVFRVIGGLK